MRTIKKILASTATYAGANVLNKAINFLFLPLFTRLLSPFDLGLVASFEAAMGVFSPFVELGASAAIARGYFNKDLGFNFAHYCTSALAVICTGFVIISVLFIFLSDIISNLLSFPQSFILFIPLVALSTAIIESAVRIWIVRQKPLSNGLFRISQSIFELFLSIALIALLGYKWQGRILGAGISEIIFCLVAVLFFMRWHLLKLHLNLEYIKDILKYGLPLVVHSLNIWVLFGIDRFFINKMVGISATGIYNVGYTVGSFIAVLGGAYGLAWSPILFENLKKQDAGANKKIVKLTIASFGVILSLTFIFVLIAPFFMKLLVAKEFYGAERYISWVAFGYAFQWMYRILSGYIFYSKKTYFIPIITTVAALTNIVLNYILIKASGVIGAAQATFWAYLVSFVLTWIFAQRAHAMPWFYFLKKECAG